MKTIGLIGGVGWPSTLKYYRLFNELTNETLGGSNTARVLVSSLNFAEIHERQAEDKWDEIASILSQEAVKLEAIGADFVMIGANTLHKVAPQVSQSIGIPLIHVAEEVGRQIEEQNLFKVALLGTRFTMKEDFYKDVLSKFGIEVITPEGDDFEEINRVIYEELVKGKTLEASKKRYLEIIGRLQKKGAKGVILGCTEIELLISEEDLSIPAFKTVEIHARAAVKRANL